jgi:hypothetical protein
MRFLSAEIQNLPIKVRNTEDSWVNSINVLNVQKFDRTQRLILIINLNVSRHTQLRGAFFYLRNYKSIRR